MSQQIAIEQMMGAIVAQMRDKLGVRADDLQTALARASHRLPRRIDRQARLLVLAEPLARHPRLRRTLDQPRLRAAADEVRAHLEAIDLADRRRGLWLGALGGLVFNLILMALALGGFLAWRGHV